MKKYHKFIAVGVCSLLLFTVYFYRDPDRVVPNEKGIIVSPADGTILYIKSYNSVPEVYKDGNSYILKDIQKYYPNGSYVIGIFMSPFDVHVNRAPISGKVVYIKHFNGALYPAFYEGVITKNERNIIIIKNNNTYIGVVQIAGTVARRTVCDIKEGDYVKIGERIGMIKLGSQTALIIPKTYNITVKKGDRVYAGESIIAKLKFCN
ncbi:archaetidylserine decarboxylase [Methanotorris formicicus]|uniref:Putative archaetidylserine decarboxylase proenzyme n=1 Tax=Methanotorris formicicus Mc-S-70 TaxID=647171 RepID=H1L002_9EURY|nr:archaetidylserine decarboxylase [Methanotorris formicicus]EHP85412.1 phosphatidylserine decarboxylase related protein [Methanotorris formicicus Mc-S-70]